MRAPRRERVVAKRIGPSVKYETYGAELQIPITRLKVPVRKITRREALGIGVAGLASIGIYQFGGADRIKVEHHELRLPRWDANGLKIALLTDPHMDSPSKYERAIHALELAVEQKPDVIILGGDYVSEGSQTALTLAIRGLKRMATSSIPTYGVLGNHDYWAGDAVTTVRQLQTALEGPRSKLLRNECVEFEGVTIAGVDDGLVCRDRHDFLKPANDKNVVCVFHEPDYVTRIDPRASLMVAGHSHGGQVCLPFGKPLHTPKGARKYIGGFYSLEPVPLYVSRGVGTIGPDKRIFCPPEVTILTLNSI